jgi:7,8-dihydro-6-hydroxymethylpterin-pyrophosphokinase
LEHLIWGFKTQKWMAAPEIYEMGAEKGESNHRRVKSEHWRQDSIQIDILTTKTLQNLTS